LTQFLETRSDLPVGLIGAWFKPNSALSRRKTAHYAADAASLVRPIKQAPAQGREMMPSLTPVNRRKFLTMLGGSIAAPYLVSREAFAQEAWPTRQVKYVNGFPAGGATDTLSRIICQKMSDLSGQTFVVENKGGAGGVLGADAVAKSPPDGYTVGLGGIASNVLAIGSYAKLPYDPRGDFTFIGGMWQLPNILVARKDLFSSDIKQLLAAFKKEPKKYTYASAGFGTTLHLSGEMMNSMGGVEVNHIPYRGAGPALTDLLGGRVDLLFDNLPGSLPSVRAGQVRAVAVTSVKRIPELPDVPTMAEVLPGYAMTSWAALIGPANMRPDLVAQVNALTIKALADRGLQERYADLGASPWPASSAEISKFRDDEEKRLLPIMQAAGIKPG
jgi:tripartite-type tricarboxylate transporter receptor subunit TctC